MIDCWASTCPTKTLANSNTPRNLLEFTEVIDVKNVRKLTISVLMKIVFSFWLKDLISVLVQSITLQFEICNLRSVILSGNCLIIVCLKNGNIMFIA